MDYDTKSQWQSRTVWGAMIAGASTLAMLFGAPEIAPEEQKEIAEGAVALVGFGGAVAAWWFRRKATKEIR